ncbi:MAG TPA: ATP-binding protein [Gallionella sp.]|nr:ATP-binding protein [Gallionella sp.]
MNLQQIFRREWMRYVVAPAIVIVGAALRIWPLQGLELRIPWVTFYPAVMIAALYGGWLIGVLTAALSCLVVIFWSPTGLPFIRDAGDWLGMAVFFVNCTMISFIAEAMLRAQARAKKAQEQAEAANRAKSVFLATMSHELRTPLNAILGFSNLMRSEPGINEGQRRNLDIINRSGEHLLSLINDVLDMAKIEAGRTELEIGPLDPAALMRDIVDLLRARAEEKGLQLLLDQTSEVPQFIQCDSEKLRQLVVNLVSNAIKYTNRGGVTLRFGTKSAGKSLRLVIEVEDSGIGISKADQARIFEPFVQVGKTATQKGTGLGLTIVREYVNLMGGNVNIDSTPGQGSLFRVDLPVQVAERAGATSRKAAMGRVIGLEPGQPSYRILIVEDQEENWLLLQHLLESAGFTVKVAVNGAEGVELFQTFRPHFIWMDRRMPVMDGVEATRRIRALDGGKEVKISAVTASAFADQREEMLKAGMDDFVRKPYQATEIFDCLAKHLGVHYVYEQAPAAETATAISADALARLPEALRRELADGMLVGNVDRLEQIMRAIEQADAGLAAMLAPHLHNFNYLPILKALETAEQNSKGAAP